MTHLAVALLALAVSAPACTSTEVASSASTGAPVTDGGADGAGCDHPPVVASCEGGECLIPSGCFQIGSPPSEYGRGAYSEDQLEVTLTHAFWIREHEITQGEWIGKGLFNPSGLLPEGIGDCQAPDCPVGNVNWYEAMAYANLLSAAHDPPLTPCYVLSACIGEIGKGMVCQAALTTPSLQTCGGYRLPTEAEWEYAARAGTTVAFYSGDITPPAAPGMACEADEDLDAIAWYCNNAGGFTHPVGLKTPNGWGVRDLLGNAAEWTHDVFSGLGYGEVPLRDPEDHIESSLGETRVTRGGLYFDHAARCRAASHLELTADGRGPGLGFRLVRTAP